MEGGVALFDPSTGGSSNAALCNMKSFTVIPIPGEPGSDYPGSGPLNVREAPTDCTIDPDEAIEQDEEEDDQGLDAWEREFGPYTRFGCSQGFAGFE